MLSRRLCVVYVCCVWLTLIIPPSFHSLVPSVSFFLSTRPRLVQGARLALDGFSPPTTPRPRTISAHHPQGKVCKPTRRKTLQGQLVRSRRGYLFVLFCFTPQGFLKIATCLSPWCPSGVPECRDRVNGGTAFSFFSLSLSLFFPFPVVASTSPCGSLLNHLPCTKAPHLQREFWFLALTKASFPPSVRGPWEVASRGELRWSTPGSTWVAWRDPCHRP